MPGFCVGRYPPKIRGRRECRMLSRTHGPPATKNAGGSHHRYAETCRHSLRDGFNRCFVLSPVSGLFSHRRLQRFACKLDPSVGRSGPHDFAVRNAPLVLRRNLRPPHPRRLTFVTIAKRPSCGGGMRGANHDFRKNESKIFQAIGVKRPISLNPFANFLFLAQRNSRPRARQNR